MKIAIVDKNRQRKQKRSTQISYNVTERNNKIEARSSCTVTSCRGERETLQRVRRVSFPGGGSQKDFQWGAGAHGHSGS